MYARTLPALLVLFVACTPADGGDAPVAGTGGSTAGAGGAPGVGGQPPGGGGSVGAGGQIAVGSGGTMAGAGGTGGATGAGGTAPTDGPPVVPTGGDAGDDGVTEVGAPPAADFPACPPGPFEAPRPGPSQNICAGFNIKYNWNEGPTWVASQKAFFFSNFVQGAAGPGDMIKYDPATGMCETFIVGNGCNGLSVHPDGSLIAACHTPRAVLKYDLTTKMSTVLVEMVEGKRLDSPNDLVAHRNGTIYFTNPPFELAGRPQGAGPSVWRRDPAGMVHLISRGNANPIGISPDHKRLYVAGSAWNLDDAGVPTRAGGFTLGGDGIAVDCAGNVYTTTGAIISPQNQSIGRFAAGTNMAFGGADGRTLLVVSGRGMRTIQMNIPGLAQ
jgi:gluconolactonase